MNFLLITCFMGLTLAEEPFTQSYHKTIGIKKAALIKAAEEATDFDGARIVGGCENMLGRYPYFGGILITLNSGDSSVCGSSLLTNTQSITAARCWWDGSNQARQFTLVFGSLTLFTGGTRVVTTNVQTHESYRPSHFNNNLAMCVHNHVDFTNNIRNIALPPRSIMVAHNFTGMFGWTVGFGRQSDSVVISPSQKQHHVQLEVLRSLCSSVYGPHVVSAATLCTSGVHGRGICAGDIGGPFELTIGSDTFLAGIASFFHHSGCETGQPAGFTSSLSMRNWIEAKLNSTLLEYKQDVE